MIDFLIWAVIVGLWFAWIAWVLSYSSWTSKHKRDIRRHSIFYTTQQERRDRSNPWDWFH